MKTIRNPSEQRLFDPFEGVISQTGWKQIKSGWQSLFRDVLLEQMPVKQLSAQMSESEGRPSAELYSMIGLLLIRELYGWTVPQAHEAILFRSDIQYALNLEPGIDITQRTIERYLQKLQSDEQVSEDILARVTDTLLKSMEVKIKKQRLDSTHVLSDLAVLGRSRMMGVALKRFFHQLTRRTPDQLERIPEELRKRYCKQSDSRIFSDANTTDKRRLALQQVAEDMACVLSLFAETPAVREWKTFVHLRTIFNQQCEVREEFIEIRKKTGGNIIQNPSDTDATYDGHKGVGYQVQICETFNEHGLPNLITSATVETAVCSDADAVTGRLDDLEERGLLPEEMTADTGYGSDENVTLAESKGVTLTAPVPGGKKFDPDEVGYDLFILTDENSVKACPAGHAPKSSQYNARNDTVWAQMNPELCRECPLVAHCRVQKDTSTGEPNGRIQFRSDAPRAAQRRRHEQTEEFRESYRWRSGIESTNSGLKRRLGLKRLRVRGMPAVKLAVMLKLTAWNILRAVAMRLSAQQPVESLETTPA
jgi:hypothetical protein